jgi:hypothetical protein
MFVVCVYKHNNDPIIVFTTNSYEYAREYCDDKNSYDKENYHTCFDVDYIEIKESPSDIKTIY